MPRKHALIVYIVDVLGSLRSSLKEKKSMKEKIILVAFLIVRLSLSSS